MSENGDFNPRAPRGARQDLSFCRLRQCYISIHVPREGHDIGAERAESKENISIHVPREGHDYDHMNQALSGVISIHVPREGHDPLPETVCRSGE